MWTYGTADGAGMHRSLAGISLVVALVAGAFSAGARAQGDVDGEIVYLEAVDLFYDERTDTLVDPDTGAEVTTRYTTEQILAYQRLVDTEAWDVPVLLEEEALLFLLDEIALLAQLDAIERTIEIDQIADQYDAALGELDRDDLLFGLEEVDQILDQIKGEILRTGAQLPPVTIDALGDLRAEWRLGIANGERLVVPAQPYMATLSSLLSSGTARSLADDSKGIVFVGFERTLELMTFPEGLAEIVIDAPGTFLVPDPVPDPVLDSGDTDAEGQTGTDSSEPAEPSSADSSEPAAGSDAADTGDTADTAAQAVDLTAAEAPGDGSDGGAGWLLPAAIAAAALVLAATIWHVASRRRHRPHFDDDALRRLIDADSEGAVAAVACGAAVAGTGAQRAILARPKGAGLYRVGSTTLVVGSVLHRVIETGTPIDAQVTDDPLLGSRAQSLLAVPVISNGAVVGILAVSRDSGMFGTDARAALELLTPSVGAALANVDRLGSVAQLALVDELTKLGNRRRLDRDLEETVRCSIEDGTPVAFAMLDVDHFKQFNDTHGHAAGDQALMTVAEIIARNVREEDIVYRYGGEEFSILLPHATRGEASAVAERVRRAVEAAAIDGEQTQPGGCLTISVGVSSMPVTGPDVIARRADQALYNAKQSGRNRVVADPLAT